MFLSGILSGHFALRNNYVLQFLALQLATFNAVPLQCLPPYLGAGLLHSLVCVLKPCDPG